MKHIRTFFLFFLKGNTLVNISLTIAFVVFVLILLIRIKLIYTYTLDLEGIEQNEVYTLQRSLAGYPIYQNPELPPYSITQKTPLYHHLCTVAGKILHISPDSPRQIYLLNRWMSLILSLFTLALAFLIQRFILGTSIKVSLVICALIFICYEPQMFNRPDSLYSLLFLAAIASFLLYSINSGQAFFLLSITSVLCVTTIFAKQSGIVLPAIIGSYLLVFKREWKTLSLFISVFSLSFVGIFFLSKGNASSSVFLANVYKGLDNPIELNWFREAIYNQAFKKFSIIFIIGWLIITDWLVIQSQNTNLEKVITFSLVMSFAFALSTGLKTGSTPSYFTEFVNIALISAPFYYKSIPKIDQNFGIRLKSLGFLLFLFSIPLHTSAKKLFLPFKQQAKEWFDDCDEVKQYIYQNLPSIQDKWIYTDDNLLKLYLYRNAILPQINRAEESKFDYTHFYEAFENGTVTYLVSKEDKRNIFTFGANIKDFRLLTKVNDYHIYVFEP